MTNTQLAAAAARTLGTLRTTVPLVQAITNYVTINDVANSLLCLGASPAMVEAKNEAATFAGLAGALYVNVGTLTAEQARAVPRALAVARARGIPAVLDPVACGAFPQKMRYVKKLLAKGGITLVKGNGGEILSLAGETGRVRGVDSLAGSDGVAAACRNVARNFDCTVMASGTVDHVSDGRMTVSITGGHELLGRVSGTGCMLGGLVAACAVAAESGLVAGVTAALAFGLAAERAAALPSVTGPMSFRVALLDMLAALAPEELDAPERLTLLAD